MATPIVIMDDFAEMALASHYVEYGELVAQYLSMLHFCEENGIATPSIDGTAALLEEMCTSGNPAAHDLSDQNRLAALLNGIEAIKVVYGGPVSIS